MESKYARIHGAGLGLAAVSYDSTAVLKTFADRAHIEFPLLSDPDSAIIRRFGILNQEVKQDNHAYGVPYPGIYVLDSQGIVKAKFFEDDYRERDTAGLILLQQFGITPDTEHTAISAKHLQMSASVTEPNPRVGQHISMILNIDLGKDMHVYAPGVKGYIPIDWELPDTPGMKAGAVNYPQSKLMRLEAIRETVPVYEGHIRLVRTIALGNQAELAPLLDAAGNLTVVGTFRYQACDKRQCFIPENVPVNITLHVQSLDRTRVPTELQRKAGS